MARLAVNGSRAHLIHGEGRPVPLLDRAEGVDQGTTEALLHLIGVGQSNRAVGWPVGERQAAHLCTDLVSILLVDVQALELFDRLLQHDVRHR